MSGSLLILQANVMQILFSAERCESQTHVATP